MWPCPGQCLQKAIGWETLFTPLLPFPFSRLLLNYMFICTSESEKSLSSLPQSLRKDSLGTLALFKPIQQQYYISSKSTKLAHSRVIPLLINHPTNSNHMKWGIKPGVGEFDKRRGWFESQTFISSLTKQWYFSGTCNENGKFYGSSPWPVCG